MQTSKQWWESVKQDPAKLINWLKNQYHGEVTAAKKIRELFLESGHQLNDSQKALIEHIALEEEIHANWVADLLTSRGIEPEELQKEERYWNQTLPSSDDTSIEELAAIAHHAETMRLERIQVICDDEDAPEDIRKVFQRILPMEERHAMWFEILSNEEEIQKALPKHELGLNALGLVI